MIALEDLLVEIVLDGSVSRRRVARRPVHAARSPHRARGPRRPPGVRRGRSRHPGSDHDPGEGVSDVAGPARVGRRSARALGRNALDVLHCLGHTGDPATGSDGSRVSSCTALAHGDRARRLGKGSRRRGPHSLRRTGPPAEVAQVAASTYPGHCRHLAHSPPTPLQVGEPVLIRFTGHCRPVESLPVHYATTCCSWGSVVRVTAVLGTAGVLPCWVLLVMLGDRAGCFW